MVDFVVCSVKCLVFGVWCVVLSAAPNEKPPASGAAAMVVWCFLFRIQQLWFGV